MMVMEEMPTPRDTLVLRPRRVRQAAARRSTAGVPAALPPLHGGAPSNRLGLARWLVSTRRTR